MPELVKVTKNGAEGYVPRGAVEHWKKKGYAVVDGGQPAAVAVETPAGDGAGDDEPVDPTPGDGDPTQTTTPDPGAGGTAAGSADVTDQTDQQSGGGRRGLLGRS